jgi:hypothetical protein
LRRKRRAIFGANFRFRTLAAGDKGAIAPQQLARCALSTGRQRRGKNSFAWAGENPGGTDGTEFSTDDGT